MLTTEVIVFIGVTVISAISIVIYINGIDKRVTALESTSIKSEDFHKRIDDLKESISTKIENEIRRCKTFNDC